MKKKVKPTSVRLDYELLEELDHRCEKVGCSRNDFIKNSVEFIINQSSDFDFGDDDDEEKEEVELERKIDETKPIVTEIITKTHEIPVIAHGKILDDYGNVVGTF